MYATKAKLIIVQQKVINLPNVSKSRNPFDLAPIYYDDYLPSVDEVISINDEVDFYVGTEVIRQGDIVISLSGKRGIFAKSKDLTFIDTINNDLKHKKRYFYDFRKQFRLIGQVSPDSKVLRDFINKEVLQNVNTCIVKSYQNGKIQLSSSNYVNLISIENA